jgi:hypothetical protein
MMSDDRESAFRRIQNEWPYLIDFLDALRAGGGEPKLVYLEMKGTVIRGQKPSRFDEKIERSMPWTASADDR